MSWSGILIGASSFALIGIFHPIVISVEYRYGTRVWPVFLATGFFFLVLSFVLNMPILSAISGVTGFSCLWSIHELFEQEKRVERGWFPSNANRKNKLSQVRGGKTYGNET